MTSPFELKNKRVAVVGLGLTGMSCVDFLTRNGADVIAMDSRTELQVDVSVPVYLGEYQTQHLLGVDLILLSPGVDPKVAAIASAKQAGIEIIGDVELFARINDKPVVAITGSNGKSTVTCLVTEMLKASEQVAVMGGNIGTPVLELLEQDADIFVLELSSFQLETVSSLSPLVATILNLSDDHLDRHGTMENYAQAKHRIYRGARHCVYNRDDELTQPKTSKTQDSFGLEEVSSGFGWSAEKQIITLDGKPYLSIHDCGLSGTHNVLNIQASAACARIAGASDSAVRRAAQKFTGLPHRFETVLNKDRVRWINDSKATNVGATIAAVTGLSSGLEGKLILIAGGEGKNADFSPMQPILEQYVDTLITFGRDGDQIAALKPGSLKVDTLIDAVTSAAELVTEGDAVLLSPACASFDMFKNYQHRGECFAQAVREVAA